MACADRMEQRAAPQRKPQASFFLAQAAIVPRFHARLSLPMSLPDTPSSRSASRKADIELLIKGVTCAVIGLVILLAPQFMAPGGIVQMMAQSYLVGWFALLLGTAFIVLFAVRRSKARR